MHYSLFNHQKQHYITCSSDGDKLSDFLVDIFNTLDFIEVNLFKKDELIFDNILSFCLSCFEEVKRR